MLQSDYSNVARAIEGHHHGSDEQIVEGYLTWFEAATVFEKGLMLEELKKKSAAVP